MSTVNKTLVLSRDTQFQPINSFNKKLLSKLGGNNDDYIISIKNSRTHSKRISKESKLFLDKFIAPNTILNAVIEYSNENSIDAETLLTEVYPLIKSFLANGFISEFANDVSSSNHRLYSDNDYVFNYKIISCIQYLDDTETYKAVGSDERLVLVKCIHKTNESLIANYKNELEILKILNEANSLNVPRLIDYFEEKEYAFLILEWIEGVSLWEIINNKSISVERKIKIIISLLDGYATINNCGILHSDIHPNNIKVLANNEVKIFDFGASINLNKDSGDSKSRAGVINYYEPELADSILNYNTKIISTDFSEQYQLAVMIYQIITGNSYLAFSYETEIVLNQILTSQPIPFSEFSIEAKEIEQVLLKALRKNPHDRFGSLSLFIRKLRHTLLKSHINVIPNVKLSNKLDNSLTIENQISWFIDEYGFDSNKLNNFSINKPLCSFFHGASGIAYVFYRLSTIKKDPELLALADIWILKAKINQKNAGAFCNDEVGMQDAHVEALSIFHGKSGILIVEALIAHSQGNTNLFIEIVNQFIDLFDNKQFVKEDEFTLDPTQGLISNLLGISQLTSIGYQISGFNPERLNSIADNIICNLVPLVHQSLKAKMPTQKNQFLGFAHGYAGLLYIMLSVDSRIIIHYQKEIEECLEILEQQGICDDEFIRWPIGISESNLSIWSGWCHGSAGHILLWSLAYKKYSNLRYKDNALKVGEYLWSSYYNSNSSICCGFAGQSLALYKLGQVTNDEKWYKRGIHLANLALSQENNFVLEDSLFQGKVGLSLLAGETISPSNAVWPLLDNIIEVV